MNFSLDWFIYGGYLTFKIPAQETYEIAQQAGTRGAVSYNAGDYIMTDPRGDVYVITPSKFTKRNDDLGNGTSMPKKLLNIAKLVDSDGTIQTSYGEKNYSNGNQYIIVQDADDYAVINKEDFAKIYDTSAMEQL